MANNPDTVSNDLDAPDRYPFPDAKVEQVFMTCPPPVRDALLDLRHLVLETAGELTGRTKTIGPIIETLKWGQASYLPKKPKVGSTVRIGVLKPESTHHFAMFFHCQSTLITGFREMYPEQFTFEGNRALLFKLGEPLPKEQLRHCVSQALTYHLKSS